MRLGVVVSSRFSSSSLYSKASVASSSFFSVSDGLAGGKSGSTSTERNEKRRGEESEAIERR